MRTLVPVLAFSLAISGASAGEIKRYEAFSMFTECSDILLLSPLVDEDATDFGLTLKRVRLAVESRLRAARIYRDQHKRPEYAFSLSIEVVGRAFAINLRFLKEVIDPVTGISFPAATWTHGMTGTHSENPDFILSGVSELMDEFIADYLRVNAEACDK